MQLFELIGIVDIPIRIEMLLSVDVLGEKSFMMECPFNGGIALFSCFISSLW